MNRKSFGDLLWASGMQSWGSLVAFWGIVLAFAGYFFAPETDSIPLKWFLVFLSISLLLIVVLIRAAWHAHQDRIVRSPRVVYIKEPPKMFANAFALFLLEPTPLLSYDAIVSIYYLEDGVERLAGVGKVVNVQDDLKIQVLVIQNLDFGDKADAIKSNSEDERRRLIVKPSVPAILMEVTSDA